MQNLLVNVSDLSHANVIPDKLLVAELLQKFPEFGSSCVKKSQSLHSAVRN
jgi:hypothetical protein